VNDIMPGRRQIVYDTHRDAHVQEQLQPATPRSVEVSSSASHAP
jgi:hypothetical protein